jgi:hypothetical protein
MVSRQTHDDCRLLPFELNTFPISLDALRSITPYINPLTKEQRTSIRSVQIEWLTCGQVAAMLVYQLASLQARQWDLPGLEEVIVEEDHGLYIPTEPFLGALGLFGKDDVEVVSEAFGFRRAGNGMITFEEGRIEDFKWGFPDYSLDGVVAN